MSAWNRSRSWEKGLQLHDASNLAPRRPRTSEPGCQHSSRESGVVQVMFRKKFLTYPMVNKLVDPENHQFLMETSLPTPMTARVYVNLPEGTLLHNAKHVYTSYMSPFVDSNHLCWPNLCHPCFNPIRIGSIAILLVQSQYPSSSIEHCKSLTGWWFRTCLFFHNIWNNPSQLTLTHIFL